jgi:DNA-binding LacI/PurR family transcriptional regulator
MPILTIKEIAKIAGVSPSAVSFVLNNRVGVSEATRKKVLEIINETEFTPNRSSRRLSLKKSFNICLAMSTASSPFVDLFYFDITRGIVDASTRYDYNLILNQLSYKKGGKSHIPSSVRNKDADGIIFLQDTPEPILKEAAAMQVPFILVDAEPKANEIYTSVNLDSEWSCQVATNYLIKKGHRDIGFITSSYLPRYYNQTVSGFSKAMIDSGLKVKKSWTYAEAEDELTAYKGMAQILRNKRRPSAMVCAGDRYAIGAIHCVQDRGLSVPGDISFIGMDNILLSSYITPPLTTISFNTFEMGRTAFELLMKKINGQAIKSIVFPSESIIERSSVREL